MNPPSLIILLTSIFDHFGFNKKQLTKIQDLTKQFTHEEGLLQQIFIPHELVDSCVYLSHHVGTPYRKPVDSQYFDNIKMRHTAIAPILFKYQHNPAALSDIDKLQARIVFSQDMMLNPDSGIKIFTYTTLAKDTLTSYRTELKQIMHELFADWLMNKKMPPELSGGITRLSILLRLFGHAQANYHMRNN